MLLYVTADRINNGTGGGSVTHHESEALKSIDRDCIVLSGTDTRPASVWDFDAEVCWHVMALPEVPRLMHSYAGTFPTTVEYLKSKGCIVTYTAAAHDVDISRREHEALGLPYDYPHLTVPELRERYLSSYLNADCLIVPSTHSRDVMRGFGYDGPIHVIPHGTDLLTCEFRPYPDKFTVGYLGAIGPDKGLIYLLQAWKRLGYTDAELLIAGPQSNHPWLMQLIQQYGNPKTTRTLGWVESVSDFYNCISVYVQPSCSEGFGLEVIEALNHGRSVIASRTCGASDHVLLSRRYDYRDTGMLSGLIDMERKDIDGGIDLRPAWRSCVKDLGWDKIRGRYIALWNQLLEGIA
jgi:glycosyltransferase involved in cell wall biosynthesis